MLINNVLVSDECITKAHPHTVKKFELIEKYVEAWAQKLLNNPKCDKIIFIDCMSNSGIYIDDGGEVVCGTPIRVAKYLSDIMQNSNYRNKTAELYFNDIDSFKVECLKNFLPSNTENFKIICSAKDGNKLLKELKYKLTERNVHYLLIYDPFQADIDWEAIEPFLQHWGEVIINHMVSDIKRGISQVKDKLKVQRYEKTYLNPWTELLVKCKDRNAFEARIVEIIKQREQHKHYNFYIAAFPFYNKKNSKIYSLIYCTSNIEGLKFFKKEAWTVFGGKSSLKKSNPCGQQLAFDFTGDADVQVTCDETCYTIKDIADYLQNKFCGRANVPYKEVWAKLDKHPIFPNDGFKNEIKEELKNSYDAQCGRSTISFTNRRVLINEKS